MAIEIVVKPKVKIPVWTKILLFLCFVGFSALGFFYFYINSLSNDLKSEIKGKEQALVVTEAERNLEKYIFSKQEKIDNFAVILPLHRKTFNVFLILELLTHPGIQFMDFSFSSSESQVKMRGTGKSFLILGQQLLILKNEEKIKGINLSGISIGAKGEINFSLQLTFGSEAFE